MGIRIGDGGVALSSMHPQGMVEVNGRRHHARAEHGTIAADAPIVVVGGDNLGLIVREAASAEPPKGLPTFGEPVSSSFLEKLAAREVRRRGRARDPPGSSPPSGTPLGQCAGRRGGRRGIVAGLG